MDTLVERASDVRLLVLDVDGVLTDGRLYFSGRGEDLKCFHVRDGAGIVQVLRAGLQIAVISGRQSRAVEQRMSELGVTWVRQGVQDKLAALHELLDILGLGPQAVASVGDDTPDLPLFETARLAVAVADAHPSVKARAHFITQAAGGQGAVREVCDLLLESQLLRAQRRTQR
ncbi:MAG TPA: 3-deoxy-manno-octulosonate-8-phosphatase KdsC [Steroidobacter sp.]|jgi:3-deoxy-D-manno-octulosonate 8-phosphate phosphatase (KDO 8-P phosphatase)|nr:3-deoxy-manno-octulosonate-8-phosphatase KdsC [Steroidobacteraceae bacterium]HLS79949.1 3-deoxy-manno-octulosonate-8-phosphatase KdsC [Steroidobacter sp.]